MRKLLVCLFIPLLTFGQSKKFKKDYKKVLKSPAFLFMVDWRESNFGDFLYTSNVLPKVISNSAKYGYKLYRLNNKFIFRDGLFNYVILEKNLHDFNFELFPSYSLGNIYKKIYFSKKSIDEAIVIKVETEIKLLEYENVRGTSIINHFEFIKKFIKRSYLENEIFNLESSSQKYNVKSMWGKYYDLVDVHKIIEYLRDDFRVERTLSIGNGTEQRRGASGSPLNFYKIVFSFEDAIASRFNSMADKQSKQINKSFNNLRFTIGGKDIRKVNTYDLKSMVKIFLDDCKKNNLITPLINTLKATFEPLDGNTIALSFAFNNDSKIIIKVDPEKWEKASIQKKWYIIYHELGHDVLNLEHGEGGKMMYNFADRDYSWDEFFLDKKYMLNSMK